jgi:hypothetical protein
MFRSGGKSRKCAASTISHPDITTILKRRG